LEAKLLTVQP